jgi:ribonucleoside-diphosphate reductase alpha chain
MMQEESRTSGRLSESEPAREAVASLVAHVQGKDAALDSYMKEVSDAPACDVCGNVTVRSGTCYKCLSCGNSLGCS